MKQSKFIQTFSVSNDSNNINGVIEVEMNILVLNKLDGITQIINPDIANMNVHRTNKIRGTIDGFEYKVLYSESEDGVVQCCQTMKAEMEHVMLQKLNTPKDKTFLDTMEEIGFNAPKGDSNRGLLCG